MKVIRIIAWERDHDTGGETIKDIVEFDKDGPHMRTPKGAFTALWNRRLQGFLDDDYICRIALEKTERA